MWARLSREAGEAAEWLNEEVESEFAVNVQGVGRNSVNGETRGILVEAQDKVSSRLLTKALELHKPKKDSHAWAWRQRDKLSTAWLLALPGGSDSF